MSKANIIRRLRKYLAVTLVITMILTFTAPTASAIDYDAESDSNELALANELAAAAADYPEGAFGFYETEMAAGEGDGYGRITIVRYGDTSSEASVTMKAIDVTAKYGEDYTLTVPTDRWLFKEKTLEAEEGSMSVLEVYSENIDSVDAGTTALNEQVEKALAAAGKNTDYSLTEDTKAVRNNTDYSVSEDTEEISSVAKLSDGEIIAGRSSLALRRNAATGTLTERTSEWNAEEAQEKSSVLSSNGVSEEDSDFMYYNAALAAAYMEDFYGNADGVEYTFTFSPGEYKKVITVNLIDDSLSESDETFMLALYDARCDAGYDSGTCSLVNETATFGIIENDEAEEAAFEMAAYNVIASPEDNYADITVRRVSGINQAVAVKIFTAKGTAEPDSEYEAYNDYVVFLPGVEERTVRVKLLTDASDVDTSYFYVGIDTQISKASGLDYTTVYISGEDNLDISLLADIDYPSYEWSGKASAGRGGNTLTLGYADTTGLYQLTSLSFRPTQNGKYISWGGCNSGNVTSYSGVYKVYINGQYVTEYGYKSTSYRSSVVTIPLSSALTDNKYHSTNAAIQVKFYSVYYDDRNFTENIDINYCKLTFSRHSLYLQADNAPVLGLNQYREKHWTGTSSVAQNSYMTLGTLTTSIEGSTYYFNVKNNATNFSTAGATPQIGVNVDPAGFQFSVNGGASWTGTYSVNSFKKNAGSIGSATYSISYTDLRNLLGTTYTDRYGSAKTLKVRPVFTVKNQNITFKTAGGSENIGYTNGLGHNVTLSVPMLDTVYATATSTALGYGVSGFDILSGNSRVNYNDLGNGKIMFGVSGCSSPLTCTANYAKTMLAVKYNPKGSTTYIKSGAVAYYNDATKELSYASGDAKTAYNEWSYTGRNYNAPHPGVSWDGMARSDTWSGDGTLQSPYLITNAGELVGLAAAVNSGSENRSKYFRLAADIDLCDRSWTPIGSGNGKEFTGVFDGNGYTISGLNVNNAGSYAGLFGIISGNAAIKNLTVSGTVINSAGFTAGICGSLGAGSTIENCVNNCSVTGAEYTGGIAGHYTGGGASVINCQNNGSINGTNKTGGIIGGSSQNNNITLTNCVNSGSVTGSQYVGGISGFLQAGAGSELKDCANGGTVSGTAYTGGIVGEVTGGGNADIDNCQNSGSVTGTAGDSSNIGGVCGSQNNTGTTNIKNCVNSGAVRGITITGGITGRAGNSSGSSVCYVEDCYNSGTVTANNSTGAIAGYIYSKGYVSGCAWTSGSAYGTNNGSYTTALNVWDGGSDTSFSGNGTSVSPYLITSAAELAGLASNVRGGSSYAGQYFKLEADIDLAGREWLPIGYGTTDSGRCFGGYFDGGGHKISGLKVTGADNGIGLFGCVNNGGWIKNLTVSGSVNGTGTSVGGLVGDLQGDIENCVSYVNVSGNSCVGGIVGSLRTRGDARYIKDCKFYGSVTAAGSYAGGLVGGTTVNGVYTFSGNINYGNVSAAASSVGGIIGNGSSQSGRTTTVTDCYNSGNIQALSLVGGLVGQTGGSGTFAITDCYNTGRVSGSGIDIGGICGSHYTDGTTNITACVNTATVTGGTNVGGITGRVGFDADRKGSVTNCYSSGSINGSTTGGIAGRILTGSVSGCSYINAASAYGSNSASFTEGTATVNKTVNVPTAVPLTEPHGWDGSSCMTWSGYGTEGSPYIISTAAELAGLAAAVNAGDNMSGRFFRLAENISLNNLSWTPIGKSAAVYFDGSFDGSGHLIGGINVTGRDASFKGLFGSVKAATIKNLAVSGKTENTGSGYYTGGLIGAMYAGTTVENCINAVGVSGGSRFTGGIAGMYQGRSTVKDCVSTAAVSGADYVGGLVGGTDNDTALTMESCLNFAAVYGTGSSIGGLCGGLVNSEISGCDNFGTVTGGGIYVGGVVGKLQAVQGTLASGKMCYIDSCTNNAAVASGSGGDNGIGGVVGLAYGYSPTEKKVIITNCVNNGPVSASRSGINDAGGVVGDLRYAGIYNSYNNQTTVSGYNRVGGVVGLLDYYSEMANCFNLGTVTAASNAGSLAGGVANGSAVKYSYWRTGGGYLSSAVGTGSTGTGCASAVWANNAWQLSANGYGGTSDMLTALNNYIAAANSDASTLTVDVNADGTYDYNLIGLCNSGYIINWKEASGDSNGDGVLDPGEATILRDASETVYNIWGYSTTGTAYTYKPRLSKSLVYYTVIQDTGGSDAFSISGGVTVAKAPIFNRSAVTYEAAVGAQIVYAGHSQITAADTKRSAGKTYSKFSSDDLTDAVRFNENGQYLVNVNYKNLTASMIVPVDKFQFFDLDSYSGIDVSSDNSKTYITRKGIKMNLNTQSPAVENAEYQFHIQTIYGDTQAIYAELKLYNEEGSEIYSKTETANGYEGGTRLGDGSFTFTLNPQHLIYDGQEISLPAGATGSVSFIGANGVKYFTHDLGIAFVGSISGFDLKNTSGAESSQTIDAAGTVDSRSTLQQDDVDSNEDGEIETVMDEASQEVKIITISYGFDDDGDDKDKDEDKEEGGDKTKGPNDKVEKLADSGKPKNKSNSKVTKEVDCDAKFAFCMTFVIRHSKLYFQNLLVKIDFHAKASVTLSYMTPVGIKLYVTIAGGINEGSGGFILVTRGISTEDTAKKADDLISGGKLELTDLYASLYSEDRDGGTLQYDFIAGITLVPFISLTLGADFGGVVDISITGSCEITFKFIYSAQKDAWTNSGTLSASCTLTVKILFITVSYEIWSISDVKLFAAKDESSALSKLLSEGRVIERGNLKNRSLWNGDTVSLFSVASVAGVDERLLKTGVNNDPDTCLKDLGNGNLLAVYLDDVESRNEFNSTAAYYTVYNAESKTWTAPQIIEDDGTFDKTPVICEAGDRLFVTWASSSEVFASEPDTLTALTSTDIHARFFDKSSMEFTTDVLKVTDTTSGLYADTYADTDPQAAYYRDEATGSEQLLIYYTKSEYSATGSNGATVGDALYPYSVIAYRFYNITDGRFEDYGEADKSFTAGNYMWYYDKYLSYFRDSETEIYKNAYDTYDIAVNYYRISKDAESLQACLTSEAAMYTLLQNRIAETANQADKDELSILAAYRAYRGWHIDPDSEWATYCGQMYGQRFLDLAPQVILTEEVDEMGYWLEGKEVSAEDNNEVDPLVIESDVISYNGLGLYAYVMDYDGKTSTTTDRDVFLQIYDFYNSTFTHPIMLTSSPELGECDLAFVRAASTTYLTYLTDGADGNENSDGTSTGVKDTRGGDIKAVNITDNIKDGAYIKACTDSGREYYYFDKTNPEYSQTGLSSGYVPPLTLAESYTDENGVQHHISSFDTAAGGDYIYALFNFSGVVSKDGNGYGEDSDINDYVLNSVYENQIYAVRYNVGDRRSTGIIQVTDGAISKFTGASYNDIALSLDGEDFIAMAEKEFSKVVYQDEAQNIYDMTKAENGIIYIDYNGHETPLIETKFYVNKAGYEADIAAGTRSHGVTTGFTEAQVGKYLLWTEETYPNQTVKSTYIDRLGRMYKDTDMTAEQKTDEVKDYIYYYSIYTVSGTNIQVQASLDTDRDNAELVSLVFNPIPVPTVKNVNIGEVAAGRAVPVSFSVYNEGLEELTGVEVTVTDKEGNVVCELRPEPGTDDSRGICIYGGLYQDILFGYDVGEDDTDVEFTIVVSYSDDKGERAEITKTISASGSRILAVKDFKTEITGRDPVSDTVTIHVSGYVENSGTVNMTAPVLSLASGAKPLGTISLSQTFTDPATDSPYTSHIIKPNTSAAFESDYTVAYNDYFTDIRYYDGSGMPADGPAYTKGSETLLCSREETAVFTASIYGTSADSAVTFFADADQLSIMSEAESISLQPRSLGVGNGSAELGFSLTAKTGTGLAAAITATATDPDTNETYHPFSLAANGLDYRYVSSDESVLKVTDDGRRLMPLKEGSASVYMILMPASSHASGGLFDGGTGPAIDAGFGALNATEVVENYLTLPEDQLMVSAPVTVTVNKVNITFYDEDKTTLLSTVSKLPDGTVNADEPDGGANRTFKAWVDENGEEVDLFSVRSDTSVYAAYNSAYNVTFYDENGSTVLARVSALIDEGGIGTALYPNSRPEKAADENGTYVFDKWVTAIGGSVEADLNNITADDTKFYASYKLFAADNGENYTVFFYSEDGYELLGTAAVINGAAVFTGGTPSKAGYVFITWVTAAGGKTSADLNNVTGDMSVYASFIPLSGSSDTSASASSGSVKPSEQVSTDTTIAGTGTTVVNEDGSTTTTGKNKAGDTVIITESKAALSTGAEITTRTETVKDAVTGASVTKTTVTTLNGSDKQIETRLTVDVSGTSAKVSFAASAISEAVKSSSGSVGVTVITDTAKLEFNTAAAKDIVQKAGANEESAYITVDARKIDTETLTKEQKAFIDELDSALVLDLSATLTVKDSATGKTVSETALSSFGEDGRVSVTVPYELKEGDDPFNIVVYFISDDGKIEKLAANYDAETKTVTFSTRHFSSYAIAYQPGVNFTDVTENDWYYAEVGYAAAKGLMKGISSRYFGAAETATRGQFVEVLYRMAGSPLIKASDYAVYADKFTDVSKTDYFYNAVVWAYINDISNGVGDGSFGAKQKLTRQQLVTFLFRYDAKVNGSLLSSESTGLSGYSDIAAVASWALDAMAWAVAEKVIKSYSTENMTLAPEAAAARSNMAAIIARFDQR